VKYNPDVRRRSSIRLKDYDYSKEGMYFITICTKNRENYFGKIMNVGAGLASAQVELTEIGIIIEDTYKSIPNKFNNVSLNEYVIMPNHIHAIIEILGREDAMTRADARPAPTIGDIISYFKSKSVCECIKKLENYMKFNQLWQRNYHEHIIRNEKSLYRIIEYIKFNPVNWKEDCNYKD